MNIKDVVSLNNGQEYAVVGKTEYNAKTYFYLININDRADAKICSQENTDDNKLKLKDVKNQELISTLAPIFFKQIEEIIKNEKNQ